MIRRCCFASLVAAGFFGLLVLWENPVWQLNWSALELVVPNRTSDTIEFHAPSEPVPAEPVPAEPVPAEPVPAEPVPAEPVPAEPVPAEPVPTEPVPAEPVPTEPVPTEPVPAPEPAPKVVSEAPAKDEMEQMGEMETRTTDPARTALPAEISWIFKDRAPDPPGFQIFRREVEELQRTREGSGKWLIFAGFGGIGNWMLGLSSSVLLASMMNRSFAHLGGPDVCGWMQGPLCSWKELPEEVKAKASKKLKKEEVEDVDSLAIMWKDCSYKKLCKELQAKRILVVQSGAWFGEILAQNPFYSQRMTAAFERPAGEEVILDIYGPLVRWLFPPSAAVQEEMEHYIKDNLSGAPLSVCFQGRWGTSQELEDGQRCIDDMLAAPWWPQGALPVIHVTSMRDSFRHKVRKVYAQRVKNVTWPTWDKSVEKQKDDRTAYKDMLLTGRCNVLVAPTGGSTYTYAATAMYHSISLRGFFRPPDLCGKLPTLPYSKLFPEPRAQLDLDKKCSKKPSCISEKMK